MSSMSKNGGIENISLCCNWPRSENGKRLTPQPTAVYWRETGRKAWSGMKVSCGSVFSISTLAYFFEPCTVQELCEWIKEVPREKYASTLLARVMENPSGFRSDLKSVDALQVRYDERTVSGARSEAETCAMGNKRGWPKGRPRGPRKSVPSALSFSRAVKRLGTPIPGPSAGTGSREGGRLSAASDGDRQYSPKAFMDILKRAHESFEGLFDMIEGRVGIVARKQLQCPEEDRYYDELAALRVLYGYLNDLRHEAAGFIDRFKS